MARGKKSEERVESVGAQALAEQPTEAREEPESFENALERGQDDIAFRDAVIAKLRSKIAALVEQHTEETNAYEETIAELRAEVAKLDQKLKLNKAAPTGDVVFLGGETYAVKRTVEAQFALEEVKRGHLDGDCTLVAIDRRH